VQVILLQAVKGLGDAGATVDVAPGYARNYLLPRGLAQVATEANKRRAAELRLREERRAERERSAAQELQQRLSGATVAVRAKAGESGRLFGSVTAQDVASAIATSFGAQIDRRRIVLEEPLKSLGDHTITVRLHADVTAQLTVRVEPA
jgi:large subunit ribosomal protein L9